MVSVSDLSSEQVEMVKEWVAEGAQMADLQKRLKEICQDGKFPSAKGHKRCLHYVTFLKKCIFVPKNCFLSIFGLTTK